ncbi:hypothetical protein BCR34DRAFT_381973 [Clohesyomyces aquaticus]|uniref:Uncharacterized protein n=1 Tax=Clohesyomyces aquaticus TaxID=1231657 RepID=A0A1Y1ZG37_9PLEO|nr:hypothetical protein BCR34DRAFT_381973 [Clohesyomyces aquaticus]
MATLDMPDLPGPLIDMDGFTKAHPVSKPVTPLDVVFSCGVCHETFADIYGGCATVEGLSDGINPKERLVTKLWLSACCHVYCGKHLEGGGPPFHPAGTRPRAACPVCAKEKGEDRLRELYSIRGFKEGEYDSAIPACWFTTPPIKLDAAGKEMEALRFQYLSLIRFAQHVTEDNQEVKARLAQAQDDVQRLQKSSAEDRAKLSTVEKQNERLRAMEPELQKFKARMPAIEHYLKQLPRMVEQSEQLRAQLASFGCHVPPESYAYNSEPYPFDDNGNVMQGSGGYPTESSLKRTASSHTAGRSAANNGAATDANGTVTSSPQARPMKRQKHNFGHAENIHTAPSREELHGRDLMPPPRGPLSKMKSMKRLWPGRKKSPKFPLPRATADYHDNAADVQMYNDGQWDRAQKEPVNDHWYDRPFTRHSFHNGGSPYMSGGLPGDNLPYSTSPLHPPKSMNGEATQDAHTENCNGPLARNGGLPIEPSYIRLMDNLSHDTGLNLGLKDPRVNPRVEQVIDLESDHAHSHQVRPLEVQDTRLIQRHEETRQPEFTFQPPNAPSSPAWQSYHPDPLRSNPPQAFAQRPVDRVRLNPITPAPQQSQQPAKRAESVFTSFRRLSVSKVKHLSPSRLA